MKHIIATAALALALGSGAAFAQSDNSGTDTNLGPGNTVNPGNEGDVLRPFYADDGMTQPLPMEQAMAAYENLVESQQQRVQSACDTTLEPNIKPFCDSLS
jgi:hypothetical protein